jgi:tetratricopeptide (TPR) repeat protein
MLATPKLRSPSAIDEQIRPFFASRTRRVSRCARVLLTLWLPGSAALFAGESNRQTDRPTGAVDPAAYVRESFRDASRKYQAATNDYDAAWQFARACFDLAEFATNNAGRAALAEDGIRVCRRLIRQSPARVEAHYYLGMNLGQLARTRTIGALRIVDEMERVFLAARDRDERFDFAGSDRNLGLLYLEAPAFGSIGNRTKARQHLRRAVELFPDYPENRLNLAEAYLKWDEYPSAAQELEALARSWTAAKEHLSGPAWTASWRDWQRRLVAAQQKVARSKR